MQVRWSPVAADDLEGIVNYIYKENPDAAQRVAQTFYGRAGELGRFPYQGWRGRVERTRELPLPPPPFKWFTWFFGRPHISGDASIRA